MINGYEVIPTVSNEFTQLTQKADAILDKINQLPLKEMVENVQLAVEDMRLAAESVETASSDFDVLIADIDAKALNSNLNQVLVSLDGLLKNYSEGGFNQSEIKETVDALVKIDFAGGFGSLNVSNAAAVALYAAKEL